MITGGSREMDDGVVRLREVRPEDSELLYRWRMAEGTRPMFVNTAEVPFATHQAFFERYFQPGNNDRWFIAEYEGVPTGTIALLCFDPSGRECEWARMVVAPEHRGHGLGMRMLRLLMAYARAIGVRRLRSEVLESNARVMATQYELGLSPTEIREHEGRRFVVFARDL